MEAGNVERLRLDRELYRTTGFNKDRSDFIECDHWKTIHFFTTNRFDANNIPSKLFVKLNRCRYFSGYFAMRYAFFIRKGGTAVKEYFRDHYFYPYSSDYKNSTCFVYSRFEDLPYEQGVALYRHLKKRQYKLQRSSEVICDSDHIKEIDAIVGI
jgi:hypothetical protein